MDASYIIYTGLATTNIPITPGQNLETILQNIDAAIAASSSAPDYSGYNLYCVKQVDGVTHPTNTQNFAEGISKNLCDFHTAYNTFTGTTYVNDIAVLTSAVTDLQDPNLHYAPFGILTTDSIQVVWSKVFTGFTSLINADNPSSASWGTLSVSPSPTTIVDGFDAIITYLSTLTGLVNTKEASLGTFDNSTNCLSGGSSDTAQTTIDLLRTYVCTLPTFDASGLTWGCVSSQTTLDDTIQVMLTNINTILANSASTAGTGLTSSSSSCAGKTFSVDTTWAGLYKCAVSASDVASAGYLEDKFTSLDGSITIDVATHTDKVDLSVTNPSDYKVKVNSGATPGYLADVVPSTTGSWGLALASSTSGSQLILTPELLSPGTFLQNLITLISTDEELLAQFCALIKQCSGCQCAAPTGFTVVVTTV